MMCDPLISAILFCIAPSLPCHPGTHTCSGRRCATGRHFGNGGRLAIRVKVCRHAENLWSHSLREADRGGCDLGAGALIGVRLGEGPWARALLRDGGETGEARDAVGALGFEAGL